MSSFENSKVATELFLENAINEGQITETKNESRNESEKLIFDELLNEKTEDLIENHLSTGDYEEIQQSTDLIDNEIPELKQIDSQLSFDMDKSKLEVSNIDFQTSKREESNDNPETVTAMSDEQHHNQDEIIQDNHIEEVKDTKDDENLLSNVSDETESSRDANSPEKEEIHQENAKEQLGGGDGNVQKDEWQDILGSGVIMKKILKEGEPDSRPVRSDKCFINYTCRLESADENNFAEKGDNYELALGEGDVVQGLDVALGLMNKKERCLLKIGSRLAFGEKGLPPHIPGNAVVVFDVELVDIEHEPEIDSLSVHDRQKMGNKKRERGNWWYTRGENTLAIQCYRRALDFLDEVETDNSEVEKPTDSELQQLLEDRLKVLNNMASAQIKMELYDQAMMSLQTVLRCQPDNVKALFRKAKIHSVKNDLPQALRLLEKARALEPDDPLIAKEINVINGLIYKQRNSEREYARRMFRGPSVNDSGSKTKLSKASKKSSGLQVWATLGATVIIGLAGIIAYKMKYP